MRATILTLATTTSLAFGLGAQAANGYDPDAAWNELMDATFQEVIDGDFYAVLKDFPAAHQGGVDDFRIQGFVVPIEAQGRIGSFLLVQDPANCPFCGTGDSLAPVLEVLLKRRVPDIAEFTEVRVTGTLTPVVDPETWQLYRLTDARIVTP
ncbi:MAG: hypothetical protein ACU0CO_13610 [Shimia sp.]